MTMPGMFSAPLNRFVLAACALGLGLAGCGGGGGGGAPVTVNLNTASVVQVLEGGTGTTAELSFPVVLSGPAVGAMTVNYSTADVDATGKANCADAGADYVSSTGSITIASGQSSGVIKVVVCGDASFDPNEKLTVTLTATSSGVLGTQISMQGTIVNDDAGGLNDTGATACGNGGGTLAACPQASHPGQDGDHGRDANSLTNADADGHKGFSFSKLDSAGNVLASGAASWTCIRDNVTGKLWEAKTAGNQATTYTWANAQTYAAGIGTLCGVAGWRLPTPQELAGLVNNSVAWSATSTATIDQTFFPEQQKTNYWSATATAAAVSATGVWVVDFQYGLLAYVDNSTSLPVRLVNGAVSAPNYQAPVSSTVRDAATGLQWQQCADGLSGAGCATGSAQAYTWQAALNRVAAVNQTGFAGFTDWRLPNRNELASIVNDANSNPALDTTRFVGFPQVGGVTPNFWTSTPYAGDATKAWSVGFKDGEVAFSDVANSRYILLVRGGQ